MLLRGRVSSVSWRDDQTGETIAVLVPDGPNPRRLAYKFWGHFAHSFVEGEGLKLEGEWALHPAQGKVFKVATIERKPPISKEGQVAYLASCIKGMSKGTATMLLEQVGGLANLKRVCKDNPARVKELLPKAKVMAARLLAYNWDRSDVDHEVLQALQSAGLKMGQIQELVKYFPTGLRQICQQTPYDLCAVPKIGFGSAEKVAQHYVKSQGRPVDLFNEERLIYGLVQVVGDQRHSGHVCAPEAIILKDAVRTLGLRDAGPRATTLTTLQAALSQALARRLVIKEFEMIYPRGLHKAEGDLAIQIGKLLAGGARALTQSKETLKKELAASGLSDEQTNGVLLLAHSPFALLMGGPGRGKTRTLRAFTDLLQKHKRTFLCLAPTGKAAKRASEMTGQPTYTIHKACGLDREEDVHSRRYGRSLGRRDKFAVDVIIVDEVSMVDVALAFELLRRVRAGRTAVVFVGDADQLPPVSAGQVLKDLAQSNCLPTALLTQVFRQADGSPIIDGADAINRGELPAFRTDGYEVRAFDPSTAKGYPDGDDEAAQDAFELARLTQWLPQAIDKYATDLKLNPMRDIQVYCPQRTGPLGIDAVNRLLQARFNPGRGAAVAATLTISGSFQARVGDKVMQVKNNYGLRFASAAQAARARGKARPAGGEVGKGEGVAVMNGQIGYVSRVDVAKKELEVRFEDLPEPVLYLWSEEWRQLAAAYAMSIHRSQGSETPYAFLLLPPGTNPKLVNRPLFYTGWTRAKSGVAVFATRARVARAAASLEGTVRYSNLPKRLAQIIHPPRPRKPLLVRPAAPAAA